MIIAPQPAKIAKDKRWLVPGVGDFAIRERSRDGEGRRYKVFTESVHVTVAEMITGTAASCEPTDSRTAALKRPRTGVMLFYPVLASTEKGVPTMGFSLHFPENGIPKKIRYGVKVKSRPNDVTVDAPVSRVRAAKQR